MTATACPFCSAESRRRFVKNGHEIRGCIACGLVFTATPWSSAEARRFYGAAYFDASAREGYADYAGLEQALRRTARDRLRRVPSGARLLDVGCATGAFVAEAGAGCIASGTDVSLAACRVARGRGLDVVVAEAGNLPFASASHDVVTMWDTVEHLADPLAALREVARVLRPGGVLLLSTGDVTSWCARLSGRHWHLFTVPEHRFFFSPESLDRALERAGLRRTSLRHAGAHYSPAYLLERLVKSLGGDTRRIEALLGRRRLRESTVYLNLFDIMTVEATRLAA
jgi:SAM-dependent methyltransferase